MSTIILCLYLAFQQTLSKQCFFYIFCVFSIFFLEFQTFLFESQFLFKNIHIVDRTVFNDLSEP